MLWSRSVRASTPRTRSFPPGERSADTFGPDVSVHEATEWLIQSYRHFPVMAGGELLGMVGIRDLLWAMQTKGQ